MSTLGELVARITDCLAKGGLFNMEVMEAGKVRDLLIDCRTALAAALAAEGQAFTEQEQAVICDLAKRLDISEHKVLVQGLRVYQLIVMGAYKLEELDPELRKTAAAPSLHKEGAGGAPPATPCSKHGYFAGVPCQVCAFEAASRAASPAGRAEQGK